MLSWILILILILVVGFFCINLGTETSCVIRWDGDRTLRRDPRCICVFDIDHTINVGNPQRYIDTCIDNNCRLAINTARPVRYIEDVPIGEMGFVSPLYSESDFYWNPNSYSQSEKGVSEVKMVYMNVLKDKYKIPKECIVLLDDNETNIEAARRNGFGYVQGQKKIGLLESDWGGFVKLLSRCN